jgi:spore coat protein U-like protein
MKKSKLVLTALAAGAMAMAANPLFAAFSGSPVTNTINVRANVVAKCDVGGTTLDFGDFDPLAGAGRCDRSVQYHAPPVRWRILR